jgi:5'-nucleotidase
VAPLLILVTNDDGVRAQGLESLRQALAPLGRVVCVAPDREQSCSSHALTLHHPLRMTTLAPDLYAVDGTPTDCVLLGVHHVLERRPDLVVSGINHGPNLGDDVNYSGTVAAAVEAARLGVPAIAASLGREEGRDFEHAGLLIAGLVRQLFAGEQNGAGLLLNVNIPGRPPAAIQGYAITRLGRRVYRDVIVAKTDPHGRPYYWIGGEKPVWERDGPGAETTDFAAIEAGRVSITPLRLDRTDHDEVARLAARELGPLAPR